MGDAVIWECAIRDKKSLPDHIQTLACWRRSECEYLEIPGIFSEDGFHIGPNACGE